MNPIVRRATPDSEALASSEDERPWPTAPSFGSLPRKENGVPGLGGGIWSTQKRGSFKMEKAAQRNAALGARLGAPGQQRSGLRADSTPSPAASEGSGALPFSIPLQPAPKAGRSMSHSQGQREVLQALGAHPNSNDPTSKLPLGLLTEEVDTESESEFGGGLTHTTSHPPIGALQRTSTYPSTYDAYYNGINGKESGDPIGGTQAGSRADRKFESAFANLALDNPQRRSHWQSHLGWDDVPNVNESRRHSLADIPTRRGSLVGPDTRNGMGGGAFWPDNRMSDWQDGPRSRDEQNYRDTTQLLEYGAIISGPNSAMEREREAKRATAYSLNQQQLDELNQPFDIPSMYKVPFIELADHERSEQDKRGQFTAVPLTYIAQSGGNRPRKQLYIVSFKCSRVDVFYLLENTGLQIKEGDIVIVEADRGQDLGTVQHANVTPDDAKLYKRKYGEEQYKWLMMFSKNNSQGSVNPNAQVYGENNAPGSTARGNILANAPPTMQGLPRDNFNNLKPKAIKRLANAHEIRMLGEKEGNEAKAKRTCQQKVAHLHLDMEILDAEWQWDFQKLMFYYYANHYINFKDLITELYRIYKTRIWLSAINPASFSQHTLGQPPSGIGPGAITGGDPNLNNSYTMTYGPDPDPYGAVRPYSIGYDTYNPNYPSIPGVANSFAPHMPMASGYQPYGSGSGNATPSMAPGVTPTGTSADYGFYYDRSGHDQNSSKAFAGADSFTGPPPPPNPYMYMYPSSYPSGDTQMNSFYNTYTGHQAMQNQGLKTPVTTATSAGLGRQATLPPPIGTRPDSQGHTAQLPPNAFIPEESRGFRGLSSRPPPTFVPGQQFPAPMTGTFLSGVRNAPTGSALQQGSTARFGGGRGGEGYGNPEVMQTYLEGLQDKEDTRADEMSRER